MKKVIMLLLVAFVALAVVFSAGCTSSPAPLPPTATPAPTAVPAPVDTAVPTPTVTAAPAPLSIYEVTGTWYGLFDAANNHYTIMIIKEDGTVDANTYKIQDDGKKLNFREETGSISLNPDGTWLLLLNDSRTEANYKMILSADKQLLSEDTTTVLGLIYSRDRDVAGIPAYVTV